MKNPVLATLVALCLMPFSLTSGPRDAQWRAVDEAVAQGLPRTAIEALDPIITAAMADRAYPEAIRAIGRRIALEGTIEGNKPEEKITRLQTAIETAPAEMKPVLEAILGHWYWHYYQQNRWRFLQRTQTAAPPGDDLQTWDLARILAEIDRHFTAALADEAALQATSIDGYDSLLERGAAPDRYRPTLWDFLVHEALQFYQAGEQGAVHAEDAFELDAAAAPVFGTAAEFMDWQPPSAGSASPILRAVTLHQKLLRFHAADAERSAFLDADLARLRFGANHAIGDDDHALYRAALERLARESAGHEIEARVLAALARAWHDAGDLVRAHATARRGLGLDPSGPGGAECDNLIRQIEAKSARIETETVWDAATAIRVHARNVARVHFRALRLDFATHLQRSRWGLGSIEGDWHRELRGMDPVLTWSADLPVSPDFEETTHDVPAPRGLQPGFYAILASHDPDFGDAANQLSVANVWVSELALVVQTRQDGQPLRGFVLEAASGSPVVGAVVRLWRRDREGRYRAADRVTTDADGRFSWDGSGEGLVLMAEHGGRTVASAQELWSREGRDPDRADTQTVFFTDRAIYRPGQTIHYKGVSVRYDQKAAKYSVISRLDLTVVFNDPNGKEIARATHRTNDHGSFSGVFTAPRDRLMGRMSIHVLNRPSHVQFSVEEYKRPKFQVAIDAPAEAPRLGGSVVIKGRATAYSGAAIGGATVKWRVERHVQLPRWCWWWQPPASKAIAHGRAVTAADGSFEVRFPAEPDRSVPEKNEPVFNYTIHADVTDTTGETRSQQRVVSAGYTALMATVDTAEWNTPDKPVAFHVRTTSLDGEPQAAEGTLTVHALVQPARVERAPLQRERFWWRMIGDDPPSDPANPDSWADGAVALTLPFQSGPAGDVAIEARLAPGIYRASLATRDRFGRAVTARTTVQVVDPAGTHYGVRVPQHVAAPTWTAEPGQKFTALWGTGYEAGRAYVELECDGRMIQSGWTPAGRTQALVEQSISEDMRGGVTLRITYVRENRAYTHQQVVDVPWSNKQLSVKWERFRSKLAPGEAETWTAIVGGPDAERASVEMVAALYDASLDQFLPHGWAQNFPVFRREFPRTQVSFQNQRTDFQVFSSQWHPEWRAVAWSYRAFPAELTTNMQFYGYAMMRSRGMPVAAAASSRGGDAILLQEFAVRGNVDAGSIAADTIAGSRLQAVGLDDRYKSKDDADGSPPPPASPAPDLSKISARRNLNETAFFFPQLTAGEDGTVRMTFTMPEALTEWRFLGFAHDRQLRAGFLEGRTVTAKDLMVEPNPPRFVREGDTIEFTVKVSNQSDVAQTGRVKLSFADAATLASVDAALGLHATEQAFDVPAKEARTYSWRITVPDGLGFLTYKAVGAAAQVSDGEEGFLPVLSRRILVTESLPLPIRGKGTREFTFERLVDSGGSSTLRHQALTVQMVSQPAWYAVMALPYLMEYPYECSEQVFNRYYANALARHIAGSDPKIRRIFDLWKNTPALDSPLAKNDDLKSVLLEETPWLRDAADEGQARRHVGLLFDDNRLDEETARTLRKLSEQQLEEGLWPWFPGGRPSEFISLYIATGFGRLRHLGARVDVAPAVRALGALDAWVDRRYREIKPEHRDDFVPSHLDAIYLYGRTFFLGDQPIATAHAEAVAFFRRQAQRHWLKMDCRMCQAQVALALLRFGDTQTPAAIVRSLRERSVSDDELGMFWRDSERSWWWYRAPIETQATMIEAFTEVAQDVAAVDAMQVWLLKQKQTQDWKTTKATADAIYALLLGGRGLQGRANPPGEPRLGGDASPYLMSDALVEVALGGETIRPEKVEAGTGFYEQKFVRGEIRPEMGRVTVTKVDEGVSWGGLHWQYLEDVAKVTPHEATPLTLTKTLWVKETTERGQELRPVSGPVAVGDELVVRVVLRTDRDMEYVHLKDQRGSGTEPVNVLSRHRYQDGLAYYESTRDTASHFFIEYLPKGVYVFEYSTRVQLRGSYQTGIAAIQCMYAPEFNSHSESLAIEVR